MLLTLTVAVLCSLLPENGQVGRWIEDLGHDNPVVRNAASLHLKAAGRGAWPDLEDAALRHPDLEVRSRCQDLLVSSRLRRRLPWRVLDEAPDAVGVLRSGSSSERVALLRILARTYEESSDLILDMVQDPDPEVVVAAAEALQERRNTDWAPRLLELYAREDCPRASRAYELLAMASSRISPEELRDRFADAGPRGRVRLVQLALNASLPLALPASIVRDWLDQGDSATRRLALSWLRERGCPGALPCVEPLLSLPDAAVVAEALATLRSCSWRPQPENLEAMLAHDEPAVREEAIQSVAAFKEESCLPALRRLLQDPVMSVRQTAISAVANVGGPAAMEDVWTVFLRDSGESRDTAAALLRAWPRAMERLRPLLTDPDPERRIRAYDLLSRIETIGVLAPLAKDRDEAVRRWALLQLIRRQEAPGAVEAIEGFAADSVETLRFDALRALVRMERKDHAAALETFLTGHEYPVRFDAAETLLTLKDDRAQSLARKLLEESDAPLRRLGYFALADRNDRDVPDRAIRELAHPDSRLGGAAAKYLRQMLGARRDDAVLRQLGQDLARLTGEPLELAFNLVVENGDAAVAAPLRELVLSGRAPRPDRALRALADWAGDQSPAELAGLLGADPSLNDSIYARLREARKRYPDSGSPELAAAFGRLFGSADRRVRRSAAQAASDLGLPLEGLIALVEDREASVRCSAMGAARTLSLTAAAPAIRARLDDDDPDVRVTAALALSALRPADRAVIGRQVAGEDCLWVKRRLESALAATVR
jgi:HEAT repeat protein